jgi:hypothetical protein
MPHNLQILSKYGKLSLAVTTFYASKVAKINKKAYSRHLVSNRIKNSLKKTNLGIVILNKTEENNQFLDIVFSL